ncbi:MAG: phosphotransferase [Candidatus Cloacimonetes bacterium]|nr:phosphotransferase [Candidatus Cloacimonadota bacterium]
MKKNAGFIIFCLLLNILIAQNISSNSESSQKSIVQLVRKDSLNEIFHIFDNDIFIGDLLPDGEISWNRDAGDMNLDIENNYNLSVIQLEIKANCIYTIELFENRYLKKTSILTPKMVKKEKKIFVLYFLIVVLFGLIIFQILRIYRRKNLFNKAVTHYERGDYEKVIRILGNIRKNHDLEYWILLEKSYLKIDDIENADKCESIINELSKTIVKTPEIHKELPDWHTISKLLKKEIPELESINFVKRLKKGFSGSSVFLVELILKKSSLSTFAVMKQPNMQDEEKAVNELMRENAGYKTMKKWWINQTEKHFPNQLFLLSEEKDKPLILFSTFADEKNTKAVKTLLQALREDFFSNITILSKLGKFYQERYQNLGSSHKIFATAYEHLRVNLNWKLQEILGFQWEDFQIFPSKKFININGKLYPNIIYFMKKNDDNWNEEGFNLTHYYLHGDLNPENVLINSQNDFVLIDFEKSGKRTFFYDLAFLSSWFLQYFIVENKLKNETENSFEDLERIYTRENYNTPSSDYANFQLIIENLFFFRKDFEQNERKDFYLSLISALLLRSFYEFRDASRISKKKSKKQRINGIKLYALACIILGKTDFIKFKKIRTQDAFDLP